MREVRPLRYENNKTTTVCYIAQRRICDSRCRREAVFLIQQRGDFGGAPCGIGNVDIGELAYCP